MAEIYYGGRYYTCAEASQQFNIPYGTLWARIANGWSVEQALTYPLGQRRDQSISHKGKIYTYSEASRQFGINISTLWRRVNSGWSIEQALTLPTMNVEQRVRVAVDAARKPEIVTRRTATRRLNKLPQSFLCDTEVEKIKEKYTLKQAAEATGRHLTTIYDAIIKGAIFAIREPCSRSKSGFRWMIEPLALHKHYCIIAKADETSLADKISKTKLKQHADERSQRRERLTEFGWICPQQTDRRILSAENVWKMRGNDFTVIDIARFFEVSAATIRRLLRQKPDVSFKDVSSEAARHRRDEILAMNKPPKKGDFLWNVYWGAIKHHPNFREECIARGWLIERGTSRVKKNVILMMRSPPRYGNPFYNAYRNYIKLGSNSFDPDFHSCCTERGWL